MCGRSWCNPKSEKKGGEGLKPWVKGKKGQEPGKNKHSDAGGTKKRAAVKRVSRDQKKRVNIIEAKISTRKGKKTGLS